MNASNIAYGIRGLLPVEKYQGTKPSSSRTSTNACAVLARVRLHCSLFWTNPCGSDAGGVCPLGGGNDNVANDLIVGFHKLSVAFWANAVHALYLAATVLLPKLIAMVTIACAFPNKIALIVGRQPDPEMENSIPSLSSICHQHWWSVVLYKYLALRWVIEMCNHASA